MRMLLPFQKESWLNVNYHSLPFAQYREAVVMKFAGKAVMDEPLSNRDAAQRLSRPASIKARQLDRLFADWRHRLIAASRF